MKQRASIKICRLDSFSLFDTYIFSFFFFFFGFAVFVSSDASQNLFAFALILDTQIPSLLIFFSSESAHRAQQIKPMAPMVYMLLIKFFFSTFVYFVSFLRLVKLWNSMRETCFLYLAPLFHSQSSCGCFAFDADAVEFKGRNSEQNEETRSKKMKQRPTKKNYIRYKFPWCARERSMYDMRLNLLHR